MVAAQFNGWCQACPEAIDEGDPITFSDRLDGFVHEACAS